MEHQNALPTRLQSQKKSNPTPATPQEENQPAANPTCAMKVNINCCNGCEVKAKKKLQKLKGVDSITYDAEQGILRISGNVNPTVVIQKLAKLGKKAELLRLDNKNPPTNGAASASASGDHGGDVPIPTNSQSSNNKTSSKKWFWCFGRKNKQVKTSSANADGGANNVSTKFDGGANNVSRKIQGPGVTNFHGYVTPAPAPAPAPGPYYMPPIYSMPMPPYTVPPHIGFFPSRPPPRMNPMIHYTNYEDNHWDSL
ncbi:hypothetical protein Q3G72_035016 [Acer saccharum]|nr:hypothetical protein Q3G72_035016 [Acer saccharum]